MTLPKPAQPPRTIRSAAVNNGRLRTVLVEEPGPDGRLARHHRVVDTLGMLERNGSIDAALRAAGDAFRRDFWRARLDPLRARPVGRIVGAGGGMPDPGLAELGARRRVHAALEVMGGLASPAGSALWHVVGLERSIREWALREGWGGKRLSDKTAAGILIGALSALSAYYRGEAVPPVGPPR